MNKKEPTWHLCVVEFFAEVFGLVLGIDGPPTRTQPEQSSGRL